jgi:6-phosphogluconolactonase
MIFRKLYFRLLRLITLLVVFGSTVAYAAGSPYLIYVGTYTDKGSKGIYTYSFDPNTGEAKALGLAAETANPSFLAVDTNGKYLYAVNEIDNFSGGHTGAVSAFAIDQVTGRLTLLQQVSSLGADPAHLSFDKTGQYLLVANYTSGNIAVFPVLKDGQLGSRTAFVQHAGSSINKERQAGPHAHEIQTSKDNQFVLTADLGLDELLVYRFDPKTGSLAPNDPAFAKISPGAGPRHFSIAPSGKFVYLVNEMASTVTVFGFSASSGRLQEQQSISTLPADFKGENTTAEIEVNRQGRFLYASNRGDDSIAVFAINPQDGKLTFVERVPTGGKTPRHFTLDPTGKWLFVANQDSNSISIFRVNPDNGRLTPTSHTLQVSTPVCVVFVPSN